MKENYISKEGLEKLKKELEEIIKVEKIDDILSYGVMITPALVINGTVVAAGRVPDKEEVKAWMREKKQ